MTSVKTLKGFLSATFLGAAALMGSGCSTTAQVKSAPVDVEITPDTAQQTAPENTMTQEEFEKLPIEDQQKFMRDRLQGNRDMQMDYLVSLIQGVRQLHVDEEKTNNAEKVIGSAINGLLQELDPHSSYMTAEQFKEFNESMSGEFVGVGIELNEENDVLTIVSPIKDSPADKAGVQPGDIITHVDGQTTTGEPQEATMRRIRGEIDTPVILTIQRGTGAPIDITIQRAQIAEAPVHSRMIGKDIGYVQLTSFSSTRAASDLRDHIKELQSKNPELKSFVLDLRYNPGGYVHMATEIIDDLVDGTGIATSMRGRDPKMAQTYNVNPGDITNGKPIVVLINEGSASASEMTAGALQDHKRAIVLGTQSFGKGTFQNVIPLPFGDAMKITMGGYYTPSGRSIQNHGITPDILYTGPANENARKITREADQANTLKNNATVADTTQTHSTCAPVDAAKKVNVPKELQLPRSKAPDYALICAVETLRNKSNLTVTAPYVAPAQKAPAAPQP